MVPNRPGPGCSGPDDWKNRMSSGAVLLTKQILVGLRVAGVAGRVARGRVDVVRDVAEELGGVLGVVEGAAVDRVAEQREPDLLLRAATGLFRYFTPDEAGAGEERRAEDGGIEGPAGRPAQKSCAVDVAQGERDVDRGEVGAGLGHVHVGRRSGEQVVMV